MQKSSSLLLLVLLLSLATTATAADLLGHYSASAEMPLSAERGQTLWQSEVSAKDGKTRSCATCHGSDLTQPGQHARSKKVIEPMAHSVNAERYSDLKKVEKWFKRNCKWTLGRECTSQEKGDILTYLLSL